MFLILKSLIEALDLGIHVVFPLHWPSLLNLPPNPITALCGHLCGLGWIEGNADERKRAMSFPFVFLNISWKARAGLIVNSGSLSLALPIFIFKTPPRNYWDLVLLVSLIHTQCCRPLHQSGCFQGCPAVIHNYPLRPSPGPLRSDGEELLHNYLIRLLQETMSGDSFVCAWGCPQQPTSLTVWV